MPMTLVFKRAKSFNVQNDNEGSKKFLAQAAPANPIPVPFWVASTETYKQGIKDGSIVNLTPPHLMPGYVWPDQKAAKAEAAEAAAEETKKPEPKTEEADEDVEQSEAPRAPFGGQPMTPVPPAPKVGQVRSGSGRNKS